MTEKEKKEKLKELEERASLIENFVKSSIWNKYLKPYFEGKVERNKNILSIPEGNNDEEFLKNCRAKKSKVQLYNEILLLPQRWINEYNIKKEEKNG
jgi:hypothetical protein